jgi:hypothetical protein
MKFTGSLAKPIIIETRSYTLLTSTPEKEAVVDQHNRAEYMRAITEQLGKIDELRQWLGLKEISEDAAVKFVSLLLALAQKFVPGFRIKNKSLGKNRGRKKEWTWEKYCQLMADVELLQREKTRSESEACLALTKLKRFQARWGKYDSRTLRNKLVKARLTKDNPVMMLGKHMIDSKSLKEVQLLDMLVDIFSVTKNGK